MARGACCLLLLLALGCQVAQEGGAPPASADERREIEQMLREVLPTLAEAYGSGDLEPMRPYVVERLLAYTEKRIQDLLEQGMVLHARFDDLDIEDVRIWGNDFGVVTTLETWDLTYVAAGGETVVSEQPDAKSRVAYQVKKEKGRWRVFHRELKKELSE